MKEIGATITELRLKRGLTQKKLAKLTNITEASLSRYENGLREPKIQVLVRLATALDCSLDFLVGKETNACPAIPDPEYLALAQEIYESRLSTHEVRVLVQLMKKYDKGTASSSTA